MAILPLYAGATRGWEVKGLRASSRTAGRSLAAVVTALALVAVTACPLPPSAALAAADQPAPGERFLQVVAHPDDDLLFMSPDLYGSVLRGLPTVTVYLTAGEGMAGVDDGRDPSAYARAREEGLRAAYAYLAGVRDVWREGTLRADGLELRTAVLADRPRVRLVFARLPDGGDPRADGGGDALTRLWEGRSCVRRFAAAFERPCLRRGNVLRLLRALYARFRPTVLRTLDPDPPAAGRHCDHPDHVASARFALAAAGGLALRVVSYRGYPMTWWAPNVDARARELKRRVFGVYRAHDYRAARGWRYQAWTERMYRIAGRPAWPPGPAPAVRTSPGAWPSAPGPAPEPGRPTPGGRRSAP